jgi:hypothetical protein
MTCRDLASHTCDRPSASSQHPCVTEMLQGHTSDIKHIYKKNSVQVFLLFDDSYGKFSSCYSLRKYFRYRM